MSSGYLVVLLLEVIIYRVPHFVVQNITFFDGIYTLRGWYYKNQEGYGSLTFKQYYFYTNYYILQSRQMQEPYASIEPALVCCEWALKIVMAG